MLGHFGACMVLPDPRIYWKDNSSINLCFKYEIYISFTFYLRKTRSNYEGQTFRISRLTDLTFDSTSTFKSQLCYLLTSYLLTSNLSLDGSREFICHDDDLQYVYLKISLLCISQGNFHLRKTLDALWPVLLYGLSLPL